MIWFYLAGFISGAVGMVVYAHWWMYRHTKVVVTDEAIREKNNEEEKTHD